jgi:hypothetical protein
MAVSENGNGDANKGIAKVAFHKSTARSIGAARYDFQDVLNARVNYLCCRADVNDLSAPAAKRSRFVPEA